MYKFTLGKIDSYNQYDYEIHYLSVFQDGFVIIDQLTVNVRLWFCNYRPTYCRCPHVVDKP